MLAYPCQKGRVGRDIVISRPGPARAAHQCVLLDRSPRPDSNRTLGRLVTMQTLEFGSTAMTLADRVAADLPGFAGGLGHPDFPCLSRAHSPSSCVPCVDFSPWLRERVLRGDADGAGEYLWRIR